MPWCTYAFTFPWRQKLGGLVPIERYYQSYYKLISNLVILHYDDVNQISISRSLRKLKLFMRNKSKPEGSMVESYIVEESMLFCSKYVHTLRLDLIKMV